MKPNSGLTNSRAQDLFARATGPHDRVLVTGATGWFGRTAVDLIARNERQSMYLASRPRTLEVGRATVAVRGFDLQAITEFAPTALIDCAFLTRDLVPTMPLEEYLRINERLTDQLIEIASLPSVARVVSISSGAAIFPRDALDADASENPYGWAKRTSEARLGDFARTNPTSVVVARAWSVSGAFVQKPRSYAFSDMILQAAEGSVHITATAPVFRRYVAVEDLLAVALASASARGFRVIDSGGPLVEMQQLAEVVVSVVNPRASITRVAPAPEGNASEYYSDGSAWEKACAETGFRPAALEQQVATARAGLTLS